MERWEIKLHICIRNQTLRAQNQTLFDASIATNRTSSITFLPVLAIGVPRFWFRKQPSHSAGASGFPSQRIQGSRKCLVFPTGCRGTRWIAPDHFRLRVQYPWSSLFAGQRAWTSSTDLDRPFFPSLLSVSMPVSSNFLNSLAIDHINRAETPFVFISRRFHTVQRCTLFLDFFPIPLKLWSPYFRKCYFLFRFLVIWFLLGYFW